MTVTSPSRWKLCEKSSYVLPPAGKRSRIAVETSEEGSSEWQSSKGIGAEEIAGSFEVARINEELSDKSLVPNYAEIWALPPDDQNDTSDYGKELHKVCSSMFLRVHRSSEMDATARLGD